MVSVGSVLLLLVGLWSASGIQPANPEVGFVQEMERVTEPTIGERLDESRTQWLALNRSA